MVLLNSPQMGADESGNKDGVLEAVDGDYQ
jgi:hypothetical protein